jgi:hypothetical protein
MGPKYALTLAKTKILQTEAQLIFTDCIHAEPKVINACQTKQGYWQCDIPEVPLSFADRDIRATITDPS